MRAGIRTIRFLSLGLILAHLSISTIHGLAHQGAIVALTTFGSVYVLVVITLAPLVAGGLLFTRWARIGALLLTLSILGRFAFGGWYHFLSAPTTTLARYMDHGARHSFGAQSFWP